MNLYYAFGGGLGHLCRSRAVINTLGLTSEDFIVLTNSEYSNLVFQNFKIEKVPNDFFSNPFELRKKIEGIIAQYRVSNLYIDTFPVGMIGDLNDLNTDNCKVFYVARILNWDNYLPLIQSANLKFEKAYVVEPLLNVHLDYISKNSGKIENLKLEYPSSSLSSVALELMNKCNSKPWLIVHSGSFDELKVLYQHALDIAELEQIKPEFIVITQTPEKLEEERVTQINYFPAADFFPYSSRIFTACGFNSMYQTGKYKDIHHFIPFERKFDDQFLRAIQRKQS